MASCVLFPVVITHKFAIISLLVPSSNSSSEYSLELSGIGILYAVQYFSYNIAVYLIIAV